MRDAWLARKNFLYDLKAGSAGGCLRRLSSAGIHAGNSSRTAASCVAK
jgi:hypothetical protein